MRYSAGILSGVFALIVGSVSAQSASPAAERVTPGALTLAPGDIIRIKAWREEDLKGKFIVNESGTVTLPLLGERSVVGIPIRELRAQLLKEYAVHLDNPSITITPLRRIVVLGEVNKPGEYPLDLTANVASAIAKAGGPSPTGDLSRIRVLRDGSPIMADLPASAALRSGDLRSGDQIYVGERGWLTRNSSFLVSAFLSVAGIIITLLQ